MTIEKLFEIRKVAIIGGGVSGISALNEFLHLTKDGSSTFDTDVRNFEPAFDHVVLFERNDSLSGNWFYDEKSDPIFPSQDILDSGKYHIPEILDPPLKNIPDDELLSKSSYSLPIVTDHEIKNRWTNSAAYSALFSNIIAPLVRLPNGLKHYKPVDDRQINPYSTAREIHRDINKVVEENDLTSHIRFSTTVERLGKKNGRVWEIILRRYNHSTGSDEWYKEEFDSVVVANGHYNIPFIPYIENLAEYNKLHQGNLLHTKSIKRFEQFKDKDVLILGSHASAVDVLKFLTGNAKSITISRRTMENNSGTGVDKIFELPEFIIKPKIAKFHTSGNSTVEFIDGSIGKFDKIIFATGYHFHYPFLEDQSLVELGQITDSNSKYSLINNLYLYSFAIQDPTFATIGIQQSPYLFATMECQATAIAGVWSNYSKLPSKEQQHEWIQKRNDSGDYHIYKIETTKKGLADPLVELASRNRKHPFDVANISEEEVQSGFDSLLEVYKLFRNGELSYDKVLALDKSNI